MPQLEFLIMSNGFTAFFLLNVVIFVCLFVWGTLFISHPETESTTTEYKDSTSATKEGMTRKQIIGLIVIIVMLILTAIGITMGIDTVMMLLILIISVVIVLANLSLIYMIVGSSYINYKKT